MQTNPRAYLQMYLKRHRAMLSGMDKLRNLAACNDNKKNKKAETEKKAETNN